MKTLAMSILLLSLAVDAHGQADDQQACSFPHQGLIFEAGLGPHFSTSLPASKVGYVVFMGAGYVILPRVELVLRAYTGAQDVQQQPMRPLWGRFPLGGGGLEATFFFSDDGQWRPYVAGGFELVTLLGQSGYNGGGPRIASGFQVALSRSFALNAELQYARWRFYNLVRLDETAGSFDPFVDHSVGGHLSLSFYPNILP